MSIPLVSNVGFTEVTQSLVDSNSGVLNDIAGTAKSKLPLQYFKLGENISGNLTMNNDSSHKKIILDTDGKTLLNSAGSPLTQNSSTALELKGSGNIQSTLKTSTLTQSDATHTGTTNFANSDSSTIAVSNVGTDLTVEKYKDFRKGDIKHSLSSIKNIKKLLGYHPSVSFDIGIKETVNWFKLN